MIEAMPEAMEASDLARRLVDLLSDRQAEDVVILDLRQRATFTDYFVIASAQNPRHMRALIDAFDTELASEGIKSLRRAGEGDSGWVLVDFGDVVVHLFAPEDRAFYDLESLWGGAGVAVVRFQ